RLSQQTKKARPPGGEREKASRLYTVSAKRSAAHIRVAPEVRVVVVEAAIIRRRAGRHGRLRPEEEVAQDLDRVRELELVVAVGVGRVEAPGRRAAEEEV